MDLSLRVSPTLQNLRHQLDVPAGWQVLAAPRLAGGWLGAVTADLAVLAPGPATATLARTHLLVLIAGPQDDAETCSGEGGGSAGSRRRVGESLALAAAADVPEAWLVDVGREWTEVYRAPFDGRYRSRTLVYPGEEIVPLALTRTRVVPLSRPSAR